MTKTSSCRDKLQPLLLKPDLSPQSSSFSVLDVYRVYHQNFSTLTGCSDDQVNNLHCSDSNFLNKAGFKEDYLLSRSQTTRMSQDLREKSDEAITFHWHVSCACSDNTQTDLTSTEQQTSSLLVKTGRASVLQMSPGKEFQNSRGRGSPWCWSDQNSELERERF